MKRVAGSIEGSREGPAWSHCSAVKIQTAKVYMMRHNLTIHGLAMGAIGPDRLRIRRIKNLP